ncbi:TetR/AcrR family transcriptional regulator [Dinoroseobacter sp. S375]|uniref:TetR/AcrR family transcriptional regulator n=1 Tax=Dinoroseobacter sp. S375 TaxID=3415136 RepID=UPI003C7EB357
MARLSGQERRSQIVEGAYAVILEKGLAATATRDVTRYLGVGSGLLHHYFATWKDLRAEVVETFIHREICALQAVLSEAPPNAMIARFIDWMISDPELRFWKLWLDAIEEARRDPDLAAIIQAGHLRWHDTIVELLRRCASDGAAGCDSPQHAAWRISAQIDGLMGVFALGQSSLTPDLIKTLLHEQFSMELGRPAP